MTNKIFKKYILKRKSNHHPQARYRILSAALKVPLYP